MKIKELTFALGKHLENSRSAAKRNKKADSISHKTMKIFFYIFMTSANPIFINTFFSNSYIPI